VSGRTIAAAEGEQEVSMKALPRITTFAWVPVFARGFVRDLRPR